MYFATNIKYLRLKHGYTQRELGKMIDLTQGKIASYEGGKGTPRFENLIKLKEIFEVTLDELVFQDLIKYPPGSKKVNFHQNVEILNVIGRLEQERSRLETELAKRGDESAKNELERIKKELIENYPEAAEGLGLI